MAAFKLTRYPNNPVLLPRMDYPWEAGSVLNPAAIDIDGVIHLLYRATPTTLFGTPGAYNSSIGVATSADGIHFTERPEPLITATEDYEAGLGCEDPRIVRLGDQYYIFYNAVRGLRDGRLQVGVALATSPDLKQITKHGLILCTASPRIRIKGAAPFMLEGGKVGLAFTLATDSPFSSIMYIEYQNAEALKKPVPLETLGRLLTHYDDHVLLAPNTPGERGPELGSPPIKTHAGWLMFIAPPNPGPRRSWHIGAMLLRLDNPRKITGYLPELLLPTTLIERSGIVNSVAYPSGAIVRGDEVMIYYGAGDSVCNLATARLSHLLKSLKQSPLPPMSWPY